MPLLKIYDLKEINESIPDGFNAVNISVDASIKSTLDWNAAKEVAKYFVERGYKLFWDVDLGLEMQITNQLKQSSQYLSLKLAIEHFASELWGTYHQHTAGVALYRGSIDFTSKFKWDEEQLNLFEVWKNEHDYNNDQKSNQNSLKRLYCRDTFGEYIELLAGHLPEQLPVYLLLDATHLEDPLELAHLLTRERFPNLQIGIKGGSLPSQGMAWENGRSYSGFIGSQMTHFSEIQKPVCGICIPSMYHPENQQTLKHALQNLTRRQIPYRIVSEELLIMEWEGLDYLVVCPATLSNQGIRKLKGFCAAGGTVINLGDILQLQHEVSLTQWLIT